MKIVFTSDAPARKWFSLSELAVPTNAGKIAVMVDPLTGAAITDNRGQYLIVLPQYGGAAQVVNVITGRLCEVRLCEDTKSYMRAYRLAPATVYIGALE